MRSRWTLPHPSLPLSRQAKVWRYRISQPSSMGWVAVKSFLPWLVPAPSPLPLATPLPCKQYPVASSLLAGTVVVTPDEVAQAVKLLAERNRVIVEGAGAAAAAAVLSGKFLASIGQERALLKNVVCICSGGGLEHRHLAHILQHGTAPPV